MTSVETRQHRRLYGRHRGRPLSARQRRLIDERLPRLALDLSAPPPARLADLFAPTACEVWLEIGFGAGEHMVAQAKANDRVGLIGCEPYVNGVAQALGKIEAEGLTNIRLHADDAVPVLDWLPSASLARVFVLFPDPWPKARHHKRRLVGVDNARRLARVMRPGAILRLATDMDAYVRSSLIALTGMRLFRWTAEAPGDWRERPADWPPTRYEAKAAREGRKPIFLTFLRA